MASKSFNPAKDIPDLEGKSIIVTGGTAGLGQQTVIHLASHNPGHIFFTGRSKKGAEETTKLAQAATTQKVPITFISMDLTSLASVGEGTKSILSQTSRIDIVFCNAGIMAVPPSLTTDGYEVQFGTNHMGHALLIKHLLPTMQKTAAEISSSDVRIVLNTSQGYGGHPIGGISFDTLRTEQKFAILGGWQRYGQSKLANMLYAKELARRFPDIISVSVHPGVIMTGIVNTLPLMQRIFVKASTIGKTLPLEQGCWSQVWCAVAPEVKNGAYYEPIGVETTPIRMGADKELAGKLWDWTEEELKTWMREDRR